MTESYDPYQNTVAERINGVLKQAFLFNTTNIDLKTIKILFKQSIETYNQYRPYLFCNIFTPNQMHKQKNFKMKTYKNKNLRELQLSEI